MRKVIPLKKHSFRQVDVRLSDRYLNCKWNSYNLDEPKAVSSFVKEFYPKDEEVYIVIGTDTAGHPKYMTFFLKEQFMDEIEHPDRLLKTAILNNTVNVCVAHVTEDDMLSVLKFGARWYMSEKEDGVYGPLLKIYGSFGIKLRDVVQVYPNNVGAEYRSYIEQFNTERECMINTSNMRPVERKGDGEVLKDIGVELFTVTDTKQQVRTPEEAIVFLGEKLSRMSREAVMVVNLGEDYMPESYINLSVGGIGSSLVDLRTTFQTALLSDAEAIMIIHNHPSSELSPSDIDLGMTRNVSKCGTMLGIPLYDSVIVGSGFKEGSRFRSIRAYAPTLFDMEIDTDYHNCIDDYESDERFSQVAEIC